VLLRKISKDSSRINLEEVKTLPMVVRRLMTGDGEGIRESEEEEVERVNGDEGEGYICEVDTNLAVEEKEGKERDGLWTTVPLGALRARRPPRHMTADINATQLLPRRTSHLAETKVTSSSD
jgi:hypothetical protein